MNKFELFTMIYYAFDLYYEDSPSELLGRFLSEMSPFTFKETGSADPAVYSAFCNFLKEEITIDNSYELAMKYVKSIHFFDLDLVTIFQSVDITKWKEGCKKYLSSEHKGQDEPIRNAD